jgi:Na+-transporting methylmalonyl-CoA/oxaloacetate decarboxylase gamma subunit
MTANPLTTSLLVTLVGMAVVFVAMSLFFASMHLLTLLANDRTRAKPPIPAEPASDPAHPQTLDQRHAAVIAVALARAQIIDTPPMSVVQPIDAMSPWADYYRHRQLRPEGRGRLA